jgi:hypothetical protein
MSIRWYQRGIVVLILIASIYASIQNLISTKQLGSVRDDPVADWEKRFIPIKEQLPFRRGVVGYISESSVAGATYDTANDEGEYVLTQYVLAPIVIVKGTDQTWNIANLDSPAFDLWSKSHQGHFEVIAFRGGLYLLHRTGN